MGFFSRLFGGADAGAEILSKGFDLVDDAFFSEEEKAKEAGKAKAKIVDSYLKWLESTSGSRMARRILALTVMFIWAFEHLGGVIFRLISVWVDDPSKLMASSHILTESATSNSTLVAIVLGFYFTMPAAGGVANEMLKKWSK